MASRENSKTDGQATSELKILDNESLQLKCASFFALESAAAMLADSRQQSQLENDVRNSSVYRLGEKIWSNEIGGYQFLIVAGKVRLREEGVGKPLAALEVGDWFGDLQKLSADFKAVAASKEVVVVCWDTALWAEFSTPTNS